MISVGHRVMLPNYINCPECGELVASATPRDSAFYHVTCRLKECPISDVSLVIEKATGYVLWTSAVCSPLDGVLYPALYRKSDGKLVWPKESE